MSSEAFSVTVIVSYYCLVGDDENLVILWSPHGVFPAQCLVLAWKRVEGGQRYVFTHLRRKMANKNALNNLGISYSIPIYALSFTTNERVVDAYRGKI